MNSDQVFGLILVVLFGGVLPVVLAVGIPLGKAWARRLEGTPRQGDETIAELEALRSRVAELEERADFAERLLSQRVEHERLSEGKS